MRFTDHATERMSLYSISSEDIARVLQNPKRKFFDVATARYIAVGEKNGHSLVVVYEKSGGEILIVTAYHTSKIDKIIETKLSSGRWVEL